MRSRQIYLIWILTNVIFSVGYPSYGCVFNPSSFLYQYIEFIYTLFIYGLFFSFPALLIALVFNHFFTKNKCPKNYRLSYFFLILIINFTYFIIIYFCSSISLKTNLPFFLSTAIAGIFSFLLVNLKIKKIN